MAITTASLLFSTAPAALATWQIAVGGLIFSGVTTIVSGLFAPKGPSASGRSMAVSVDPTGYGEFVYGQIRRGGMKTYHETTGNGKFYHYFLTLAMHEVEEIGSIYINDEVVTVNASGFVTSGGWNSKILIKKFTGASSQNIYTTLSGITNGPAAITSGFRGRGVASLYVRLEYDADVFQSGVPLITAVVKGRKVYDPRKDGTSSVYDSGLGVASHRSNDPTTWQYSSNPVLALRDYLTHDFGCGALQSEIDDTMIATAADACASVGVSGAEENSFEIGGSLSTSASKKSNLEQISKCFNGTLFFAQGKFKVLAGAYAAPTISTDFTLDDIRGPISVKPRVSRANLINTVRGTFTDKDNRWIGAEFPQVQLADLAEDGNLESIVDLDLPLVTKSAQAQRLAKQILYTSREQITVSTTLSTRAYQLQVGDRIYLTIPRYGWTSKVFQVVSWQPVGGDGSAPLEVAVVLKEDSSTAYQWSVSADEYAAILANNTSLEPITLNLDVTNLAGAASSQQQPDGTVNSRIALTWTAPANAAVDHYLVEWLPSGVVDEYNAATTKRANFLLENLVAGQSYAVRVTAFTIRGNKGAVATGTFSATGDSLSPKPPTTALKSGGHKTATISWTAPTQNTNNTSLTDLQGYWVYRDTVNTIPASPIAFVSATKFTDGGLSDSTTYYYWVKALDFSGNASTALSIGSVTTLTVPTGPTGPDGKSVYTALIFKRSSTAITTAPTGGSFNFGTNTLTAPSTWSTTVPSGTDPVYSASYTFSVSGDTGTSSAGTWSTPVKYVENGADGTNGTNGLSTYLVSIFKRSSSALTAPTGGSYNFGTNTLTVPSGWSASVPSGTDPVYTSTTLASVQGATGTDSSLTWTTPVILAQNGATGATGARGAGRWNISVSSLPTTSSGADTAFTGAIGNPVDKDQAWFYTGDIGAPTAQGVWIYALSGDTWTEQDEVIDGNLVVSGTITGDKIETATLNASHISVDNLAAIKANLGEVTIDKTLTMENANSAFIGGKTGAGDLFSSGYYFGRTNKGTVAASAIVSGRTYEILTVGTSNFVAKGAASNTVGEIFIATSSTGSGTGTLREIGFELTASSSTTTQKSALTISDSRGINLINPTLWSGTPTSSGNVYTANGTYNAGAIDSITITALGGGGGGGAGTGRYDYSTNNTYKASNGGTTTVQVYDGNPASGGTLKQTITATGGAGGYSGAHYKTTGGSANGDASTYGSGGSGGGFNVTGSNAPSASYGAGGGGGGYGAFQYLFGPYVYGYSGDGGAAGQSTTQTIDTSSYSGSVYLVVTLGAGGSGTNENADGEGSNSGELRRSGGNGKAGAVSATSDFSGLSQIKISPTYEQYVYEVPSASPWTSATLTDGYSYIIMGYIGGDIDIDEDIFWKYKLVGNSTWYTFAQSRSTVNNQYYFFRFELENARSSDAYKTIIGGFDSVNVTYATETFTGPIALGNTSYLIGSTSKIEALRIENDGATTTGKIRMLRKPING